MATRRLVVLGKTLKRGFTLMVLGHLRNVTLHELAVALRAAEIAVNTIGKKVLVITLDVAPRPLAIALVVSQLTQTETVAIMKVVKVRTVGGGHKLRKQCIVVKNPATAMLGTIIPNPWRK